MLKLIVCPIMLIILANFTEFLTIGIVIPQDHRQLPPIDNSSRSSLHKRKTTKTKPPNHLPETENSSINTNSTELYDRIIFEYKKKQENSSSNISEDKGKQSILVDKGSSNTFYIIKVVNAYINRGNLKAEQNNFDEAISDYTEAIKLDPTNVQAYKFRAIVKNNKEDYEGALADYQSAYKLEPDSKVILNSLVYTYKLFGNKKFQENNFDEAISDYTEAIKLDPTNIQAYKFRATAYSAKGNYEKIIEDLTKVKSLAQEDLASYSRDLILAYKNLGYIKHQQGNYEAAIIYLTEASVLEPENKQLYDNKLSIIYNDLGLTIEKKGDALLAITHYKQAINLDPKNVSAYYNSANVKAKTNDYNGAIIDYTVAIKLNPKYVSAYIGRAAVYRKQGLLKEAEIDEQTALKIEK